MEKIYNDIRLASTIRSTARMVDTFGLILMNHLPIRITPPPEPHQRSIQGIVQTIGTRFMERKNQQNMQRPITTTQPNLVSQ